MSLTERGVERLYRELELGRASVNGEEALVDGVYLNLALPYEDQTKWRPTHRFGVDQPFATPPYLIFPWTSRRHARLVRQYQQARTIRRGDIVLVSRTARFELAEEATTFGRYEAEEDREGLAAYLYIRSANGNGAEHPVPMPYHRRGATIPPLVELGGNADLRRTLVAALEAATGWPDLEAWTDERAAGMTVATPPAGPGVSAEHTAALIALLDSKWGDEDALIQFGFRMARAMFAKTLLPRAKDGGARAARARRQTERARQARRESATVKPMLQAAALRLFAECDGAILQNACALALADEFYRDQKVVWRAIDPLFEKGPDGHKRPIASWRDLSDR